MNSIKNILILFILTFFLQRNVLSLEQIFYETSSTIEFAKILEYEINLSKIVMQNVNKNTFLSVKVKVTKNKACTTKVNIELLIFSLSGLQSSTSSLQQTKLQAIN